MRNYFITRLLFFIPSLFFISLLAFLISINAPGDPVDLIVQNQTSGNTNFVNQQRSIQKEIWRKKLGTDLPVFYISLHPLSEPDTLYKIYPIQERVVLTRLIDCYGNWKSISTYYQVLKISEKEITLQNLLSDSSSLTSQHLKTTVGEIQFEIKSLLLLYNPQLIKQKITRINNLLLGNTGLINFQRIFSNVGEHFTVLENSPTRLKNYLPAFSFYSKNQYHRWFFGDGDWLTGKGHVYTNGVIRADFGKSYTTGLSIYKELKPRIKWSLIFAVISLFIAYMVSVPIGIMAAVNENKIFDRLSGNLMFLLYSLPVFWVATLLLLIFANTSVFSIFPASGVMPTGGFPINASIIEKITSTIPYLILPLFCYSYGIITYFSRTIRNSILHEFKQEYIKTAFAKGLSPKQVWLGHAFANTKIPLITLFANAMPVVISGSLIIESIFSIPGMGLETIYAVQHQNYPVIVAIFTITGFISLGSYFVADLLYVLVDPRISYQKTRH